MLRFVVAVLLVAARAQPVSACAPAPPKGATVEVAEEEAAIVWDAQHHVEHFIRKATFRSTAKAFGFLVPTPTVPKLDELPPGLFPELDSAIAPRVRTQSSGYALTCVMAGDRSKSVPSSAHQDGAVHVLQTTHVAGFDATTIESDNTAALAGWLADHGFEQTPALSDWLAAYVDQHWKITAFVVASDEASADQYAVATGTVHMTFSTERPFYPYREPASSSRAPRLLRVFFLAGQRFDATLAGKPWTAPIVFAAPIAAPDSLRSIAATRLVATVFEDRSAPRRGIDEVYFAPSPRTDEVRPPDIVVRSDTEIPMEAAVPLLLVAALVVLVIRRRRRARREAARSAS